MDPSPKSPNNKFVESGRKSQSESRIKLLVYSVKRKELYTYICRKYPRTDPNTMIKSTKFFLLAVVFLQPLCFFSFFFFSSPFSVSLSFFLFSYYILWFFTPYPPSTCGSGVGSPFSLLPLPFLELSILSCKATCSLFRHHLHINAVRELAGQHLMRGQQYSQIFVFSHSYPLSDIFSSPLLQGLSETLPLETDKSTSHLGQTFQGSRCPRTRLDPTQAFFTSFRSATIISSFTGRPQILSYPRTGYWAQPFLMQFEHIGSIGPHINIY